MDDTSLNTMTKKRRNVSSSGFLVSFCTVYYLSFLLVLLSILTITNSKLMHQEAKTYRQTKNLLVRRSSLLDGGHLYAMGDLAES